MQAPGLDRGGSDGRAGRGYRTLSGELAGRLALELDVPAARSDPAAVSLAEVRILGELDPVTFIAREEHVIEVAGDSPVLAEGDAPLLAHPDARRRFGSPLRSAGERHAPRGASRRRGPRRARPLAPGETVIEVRYRMPVGEGPFSFARRFAARVPLLSVYLADTGNLRVESERLHRRRPAQTPDRSYIHLEAFELAPGEEAKLAVFTLPARRAFPRAASLAFVALATALAALALAAPLRGRGAAPPEVPEVESAAHIEREALELALGDLEHDFETGKLDAGDYERMQRRAPYALPRSPRPPKPCLPQRARLSQRVSPRASEAARGAGIGAGREDRFCAHCGARLA